MFKFSVHSKAELATIHPVLREAAYRVLRLHDFRVEQGARSRAEQQAAYIRGDSKVSGEADYPHMPQPDNDLSNALDVRPIVKGKYLDPKLFLKDVLETSRWCYFLGLFVMAAEEVIQEWSLPLRIRSGINWDRDAEILGEKDRKFPDAYHIELEEKV